MSRVAITAEAADVLSRSTIEGSVLRLPAGQLDRKVYTSVNNVLVALGGKWDKRQGGHVFASDPQEALNDALVTGAATSTKKLFEQFFTPKWLAATMADAVGLKRGDHVLEPSAGMGALLADAIKLDCTITAIEKDEILAKGLIALLGGMRSTAIYHVDFMEWRGLPDHPAPTVVLMNPPFSKGQDVRHITKAWGLLAPGGRMAAIMGEHAFFATDTLSREFRAFLETIDAEVEELPAGTFKESGTSVKTRLIVARKTASPTASGERERG